jgi:hypothetical protein
MSEPKNSNAILYAAATLLGLIAVVSLRPSPGPSQAEFDELQAQLEELKEQVTVLQEAPAKRIVAQADAVRGRKRGGPGTLGASNWGSPERSMRDRIRHTIETERPGGAASVEAVGEALEADPEVRGKVANLVREELAAERDQRWERRAERRQQRDEQSLDDLSSRINLTAEQRVDLSAVLSDERETIGSLFRAAREDGSWHEARDQATTIRAENDERVRELLDEGQFAGWDAMRTEDEERRRH